MAIIYFSVKYKHRKAGTSSWASSSFSGSVKQQSETLVMQMLQDKHKGSDVVLVELKWK